MSVKFDITLAYGDELIRVGPNDYYLAIGRSLTFEGRISVDYDTGMTVSVPEGWHLEILPVSATFTSYGLVMPYNFGVGVELIRGRRITVPIYAQRNVIIPRNTRLFLLKLGRKIKTRPIIHS